MKEFEIDVKNQYNLPEGKSTSTCPKCSHNRKPENRKQKCLMIDWERALATCQHCEEVLQIHTYKKKGQDSGQQQPKKDYTSPPPAKASELPANIIEFFKGRGISERTLVAMGVTHGIDWMPQHKGKVQTIHFNYYENGKLVNTKYRGPQKAFMMHKGAKLVLSGIDRWKDEKEVIIVEGEMDEASWIEAGFMNVSSVPNGATKGNINLEYLDNSIDYLENKEKIYLCVDNDEAGQNLENELKRRLGAERCFKVPLRDYKDSNELLTAEGVKSLREAYFKATAFPLENVATFEDEREAYYNFLLHGIDQGLTIGLPSYDKVFSTYINQPIVVTGIPSHGKSDWVDQKVLGYAFHHNLKVAYASPENKPNYLHIHKLIAKVYGKFPNAADIGNPVYSACESFVNDYINFIEYKGGYYLEDVLDKAAELVKRKGIKVLVIDPYNKVVMKDRKRDEDSYTPDYLFKIAEFCAKYDVLPVLVAHPTKMKKANGESKAPVPDMYSIRGTGDFYDMMPHGEVVYRDFETNLTLIKILKCKFSFQGQTGAETWFAWNPENGRYSEVDGDLEDGTILPNFDSLPWVLPEKKKEEEQPDTWAPDEECPF